jgi:hypothetical protein
LRAKIRSLEEFSANKEESDSLALVKSIRNAMYSYQSVLIYQCVLIHNALKRFWQLHQGKLHSCQQYLEELENNVAVIDHCGGLIGAFPVAAQVATWVVTVDTLYSCKFVIVPKTSLIRTTHRLDVNLQTKFLQFIISSLEVEDLFALSKE